MAVTIRFVECYALTDKVSGCLIQQLIGPLVIAVSDGIRSASGVTVGWPLLPWISASLSHRVRQAPIMRQIHCREQVFPEGRSHRISPDRRPQPRCGVLPDDAQPQVASSAGMAFSESLIFQGIRDTLFAVGHANGLHDPR